MLDASLECNGGSRPNWPGRLHSCGTVPNYKTSWRPSHNIFSPPSCSMSMVCVLVTLQAPFMIIHDIVRCINNNLWPFVALILGGPETLPSRRSRPLKPNLWALGHLVSLVYVNSFCWLPYHAGHFPDRVVCDSGCIELQPRTTRDVFRTCRPHEAACCSIIDSHTGRHTLILPCISPLPSPR